MILSSLRSLFRAVRRVQWSYRPLIEICIFQKRLLINYHAYQDSCVPLRIAPVLKSNAYGHGLVEIARILDSVGAPFFMVDSYHEALILRNEKIRTPLLIAGFTPTQTIAQSRLRTIAFTIGSVSQLEELSRHCAKSISIHLKIDTGMHRHGVLPSELDCSLELIMSSPSLKLEGIASHLADPDTYQSTLTENQITQWNDCVMRVKDIIGPLPYAHCLATAGLAYRARVDSNVLRLGIGLYGIPFGFDQPSVQPALELRTIITSIKHIEEGESVGYNGIFRASSPMIIATIPCGYAEGMDRRLSNQGFVRVNDQDCPIVGRISMNITTIDVSHLSCVKIGDEVIVFSSDGLHANSIAQTSKLCTSIPHELLVHIPSYLRRKVIG